MHGSSRHVSIHGHDVSYRGGGSGPVVVLIHGMAGSSVTWEPVLDRLAEHCTVVAPDLLGHGESDKPRGDYSLGAHASSIRDLLIALGHDRATIVGQSFGGGVAMQLAYQYPERCERLVLVASGGLGQEVALLFARAHAARGRAPDADRVQRARPRRRERGHGFAGPHRAATGSRGRRDVAQLRVPQRCGRRARPSRTRCARWSTPRSAGERVGPPVPRRGLSRRSSCGVTATRSSRWRTASRPTKRSPEAGSRSSKARATTRTASSRSGSRICWSTSSNRRHRCVEDHESWKSELAMTALVQLDPLFEPATDRGGVRAPSHRVR